MNYLKYGLRRLLPQSAIDLYRRARFGRTWIDAGEHSVRRTFTEIYRRGLWGRGGGHFYSGPGSDPQFAATYCDAISRFIRAHSIRSVLDLGCGDFRIGQVLAQTGVVYHGVDIVRDLIDSHTSTYGNATTTFGCLDITKDPLPSGADLCLIRQVLQHLSNRQITAVLERCRAYDYLIVTEHMLPPHRIREVNRDICHGADTRVDEESCVELDKTPFNCKLLDTLAEVHLADGSFIRSVSVVP